MPVRDVQRGTINRMTVGRPPKFSKKTLQDATDYLLSFDAEECNEAVPSVEGLALHLDISRETVYAWAKEKPLFSDIVALVRTKKSYMLQNKGLKNEVNASIAKLLLGHEGYRDQQDLTSNDKPIAPLLVRFIGDDKQDSGHTEGV